MLFSPVHIRLARPNSLVSMLSRWRYQALGGLFFATVLPYLVRIFVSSEYIGMRQLNLTLLWSALAVIIGNWLWRNVSLFPGLEASTLLIPTFSVSFAAVSIFLAIGRFEYARSQLIAGFIISIIWFYFVRHIAQRHQWLRIGYLPFGAVDELPQMPHISWIKLTGEDCSAGTRAATRFFDVVAADLRIDLPDHWERALSDFALAGVPVYHVKSLTESLTGKVQLEHLSENSFGSLIPNVSFLIIKRLVDWIVAAIAGVILLIPCIVVGIIIKITSPGPALFRQLRVGFRGKPFMVYKFRTMQVAEPDPASERRAAMTQARDARVTPLGRILRHSRIDELPQIINILKGEMSWIGPRPEAEVLSRWYETQIPFYRYRHIVIPGLTGWAQITQGHVAEIEDVRDKLHYDFYYIKNFSLWMDLLIIGRTIKTVITGHGSR